MRECRQLGHRAVSLALQSHAQPFARQPTAAAVRIWNQRHSRRQIAGRRVAVSGVVGHVNCRLLRHPAVVRHCHWLCAVDAIQSDQLSDRYILPTRRTYIINLMLNADPDLTWQFLSIELCDWFDSVQNMALVDETRARDTMVCGVDAIASRQLSQFDALVDLAHLALN